MHHPHISLHTGVLAPLQHTRLKDHLKDQCWIKTPVSPNCKTIPRRSGHRYIPPPIWAEHDMFVVCLGTIGEGRAGHGQQVGVGGHQRRLRRAQQAPAGATQAAAPGQRGADQRRRWGRQQKKKRKLYDIYPLIMSHLSAKIFHRLTWKLRNDGRRVLIQVVHPPCDRVRGHGHTGHDYPAVVRVQCGRQAWQTRVVHNGEVAKFLDLLPAVQPLLQARRHLWQSFPEGKGCTPNSQAEDFLGGC